MSPWETFWFSGCFLKIVEMKRINILKKDETYSTILHLSLLSEGRLLRRDGVHLPPPLYSFYRTAVCHGRSIGIKAWGGKSDANLGPDSYTLY